jgi:hypothetical protein
MDMAHSASSAQCRCSHFQKPPGEIFISDPTVRKSIIPISFCPTGNVLHHLTLNLVQSQVQRKPCPAPCRHDGASEFSFHLTCVSYQFLVRDVLIADSMTTLLSWFLYQVGFSICAPPSMGTTEGLVWTSWKWFKRPNK